RPHTAVEDFEPVIVDSLDDLVADAQRSIAADRFGLARRVRRLWIERGLQNAVQSAGPDTPAVHRRERLNVLQRVIAEAARQALCDRGVNPGGGRLLAPRRHD